MHACRASKDIAADQPERDLGPPGAAAARTSRERLASRRANRATGTWSEPRGLIRWGLSASDQFEFAQALLPCQVPVCLSPPARHPI